MQLFRYNKIYVLFRVFIFLPGSALSILWSFSMHNSNQLAFFADKYSRLIVFWNLRPALAAPKQAFRFKKV